MFILLSISTRMMLTELPQSIKILRTKWLPHTVLWLDHNVVDVGHSPRHLCRKRSPFFCQECIIYWHVFLFHLGRFFISFSCRIRRSIDSYPPWIKLITLEFEGGDVILYEWISRSWDPFRFLSFLYPKSSFKCPLLNK